MNKIPSSKERKYIILNRLLNKEHLSYHHLAKDYIVSRSSIANDIDWIKRILAEDNIALKFDNQGTFIDEDEIKIQNVIKRVVFKLSNSKIKSLFLDQLLYKKLVRLFLKPRQNIDLKCQIFI